MRGGSEIVMVTSQRWWILNCRTIQRALVSFLNFPNFLKFLACPSKNDFQICDFGMDSWVAGICRLGIPEWIWPRV